MFLNICSQPIENRMYQMYLNTFHAKHPHKNFNNGFGQGKDINKGGIQFPVMRAILFTKL